MDWLSPVKDLFGFIFPFLEGLPILRAILGFALVFFLPGFAWTLVFFRGIKLVERLVFSVALSLATVTLSLILANLLLGINLTGLNAALIIVVITIIPAAFYYLDWFIRRRRGRAT